MPIQISTTAQGQFKSVSLYTTIPSQFAGVDISFLVSSLAAWDFTTVTHARLGPLPSEKEVSTKPFCLINVQKPSYGPDYSRALYLRLSPFIPLLPFSLL